jgi:uncharacterized membrane protein YhfC
MSTIIAVTYVISGFVEVVLPVILGFIVIKRLQTSWKIWFIGALMFLVSLVRFPLNNYLTQLIISGNISGLLYALLYFVPSFTAGLFEETARYIGIKHLVRNEGYKSGLTYGAGHGGIESIFIVGINIFTIGILLIVRPEAIPETQKHLIFSNPWFFPLIGVYERVMALVIQISLTVMVLEAIRQKKIRYLLFAIILHTSINYLSISALNYSILYAEMVVTGFAIGLSQWAYSKVKDDIIA